MRRRAEGERGRRLEGAARPLRESVSWLGTHERSLRELADEGFDLPGEGVVLAYPDRGRERGMRVLLPSRAAAEAFAAGEVRRGRARRGEVRLVPLAEALA